MGTDVVKILRVAFNMPAWKASYCAPRHLLLCPANACSGKITDVERTTSEGFARGHLSIEGTGPWSRQAMRIDFQNENLIARMDGHVLACVPDLICCLETEGAAASAPFVVVSTAP